MASPTRGELETQLSNIFRVLDEFRRYAHVNAENYLGHEDTLTQSLEGDVPFARDVLDGLASFRESLASAIVLGESMTTPILRAYMRLIQEPETEPQEMITRIYQYMVDNSLSVNSRSITFGAVSAGGSNVGDGTINRLTVDENNEPIENVHVELKTFRCIQDEHSGANEHEEVFEVRGETREPDDLFVSGSGLISTIRSWSARDSLLSNPSFSSVTLSGTSITTLTDWTVSGSGNLTTATGAANIYRDFVGDDTPRSLQFDDNERISQNLNVNNITLQPNVPYYLQLAYNRAVGSGDGNLVLRFGSQSVTVALSAQAGWNILRIAIDQNQWFDNFNEEDIDVEIELNSRTTGTLLVDDVILVPYEQLDGAWYCMVGGATPFLREDTFTYTDTEGTYAIIQNWFARIYGRHLPSDDGGSETWSDPS